MTDAHKLRAVDTVYVIVTDAGGSENACRLAVTKRAARAALKRDRFLQLSEMSVYNGEMYCYIEYPDNRD